MIQEEEEEENANANGPDIGLMVKCAAERCDLSCRDDLRSGCGSVDVDLCHLSLCSLIY